MRQLCVLRWPATGPPRSFFGPCGISGGTVVEAGLGLVGVLLVILALRRKPAFEPYTPPPPKPPPKPIPKGLSRQKFLLRHAERMGVTTQWMKELGYSVVPSNGDWVLVPPTYPEELGALAGQALAEILSRARVDQDGRIEVPTDSPLWICQVAAAWATAQKLEAN